MQKTLTPLLRGIYKRQCSFSSISELPSLENEANDSPKPSTIQSPISQSEPLLSEESIETDEEIKGSLLIISQKKQRQR